MLGLSIRKNRHPPDSGGRAMHLSGIRDDACRSDGRVMAPASEGNTGLGERLEILWQVAKLAPVVERLAGERLHAVI